MIFITSSGEIFLLFVHCQFCFFCTFHYIKKKKKKKQCCRIISVLSWVALLLLQGSYSSELDIVNQD